MKKLLTYSVVIATIVWSLGLAAVVPMATAAYTPVAGDLVKTATDSAVYYIDADGQRHLFVNAVTFWTWYNGDRTKWTGIKFGNTAKTIKIISADDLLARAIGSNVTARPGVNLIKFQNSPRAYAVLPGAKLAWVTDQATAVALYGADWSKKIITIQNGFETNYDSIRTELTTASKQPDGSLVKFSGSSDIYYIQDGAKRKVSTDAFVANGFKDTSVLTSTATFAAGTDITAQEAALSTVAGTGSGSVPVASGTGLTVALAAGTPPSGVVIYNSYRNSFTKVSVTASADGPITIDTWMIKRTGVGNDAAFSGVNIIDDATNRTISDIDKSFNTDGVATITTNAVIPAGTTKTYTLVGTMANVTTYAGESSALQLSDLDLSGSATLSGSLPITGNPMTINGSIVLDNVAIARGSASNASTTVAAPTKIGEKAYTVFAFSVEGPANEDVKMEQVKLYQTGTANLGVDVTNFKLYNALNGTLIANGSIDGSYVYFTPASGILIAKGQTEQYKVVADIEDGTARTVKMAFYRNTDILIKGNTFNAYSIPGYSGTGSFAGLPYLTDNEYYIGGGTFTVQKSNTVVTGNIAVGSDQTLGAFAFDVKGEALNVSAFTLVVASSSPATAAAGALTAVKLVDSTGKTVAGPTDHANGSLNIAWTDDFQIPVGVSVYKIVGKLNTSKGWATDNWIEVKVTPSSQITATGEKTGQIVTSGTTAQITANRQTVKAASLSITRNTSPGSQTVIVNSSDVQLGAWNIDATNAGEDIRITQLAFAAIGDAATNTSNLIVKMDGVQVGDSNSAVTGADVDTKATSTFTFSSPIVIPKGTAEGTAKTISLYGNKTSVASNATEQWGLTDVTSATNASVVAYGKDTGVRATVTLTTSEGATVTSAAAGTIALSLDGAPSEKIIKAGSTMVLLNKILLDPANSTGDVTKLIVTVGDGTTVGTATGDEGDVDRIYLKSNGAFIGLSTGYAANLARTTINLDPGTFVIPAAGRHLEIYADISTIVNPNELNSLDSAAANAAIVVSIAGDASITALDSASNEMTVTVSATSSNFVLHKSQPVVTSTDVSFSGNQGTVTRALYKVNITALDGPVSIYRLSFLTGTSTVNLTNGYLNLVSCSSCKIGGNNVEAGEQIISATTGRPDASTNRLIDTSSIAWSFTLDDLRTAALTQEALEIPAGGTAVIEFRATVSLIASGTSVSTQFLGDATATTTGELSGDKAHLFTLMNQGNFVWSDLYADYSGADTTSTEQWYNGYNVSGARTATSTQLSTIGYST